MPQERVDYVVIRREQHADILDVAAHLSEVYGSNVNAIVQMIRSSSAFKRVLADLEEEHGYGSSKRRQRKASKR